MSEQMQGAPDELQADLIRRLRRIEGQAQGVQKMLEEKRGCDEIFNQLKSIHAAAYGACLALMRQYALQCMRDEGARSREQALDDMMSLFLKLPS